MFLDVEMGELMRPLLTASMAAVNSHRAVRGETELSLRRGETAREQIVGETQILRFRASVGPTGQGAGDKMHIHCDRPGTRWVAIMALGNCSTFVFDDALSCEKCFLPSRKPEDKCKKVRQYLYFCTSKAVQKYKY